MKILLFGARGQVGSQLERVLRFAGELTALDRNQANFEDPQSLKEIIDNVGPHVIINAAAYTQVDKAESEAEKAYLVNGKAAGVLAQSAKAHQALLVHYSTDYVFDGTKRDPYLESDQTCPINVYGESKLEGEEAILKSGCNHFIFRTSWVYGTEGSNFIKTILRLAKEREALQIVNDQFGVPTSAEFIADVTATIIQQSKNKILQNKELKGIYNLVPTGETTWYGFSKFIIEQSLKGGVRLACGVNSLVPIDSESYPVPAMRPKNSRLDTKKIVASFGISLPNWQIHATKTISDLVMADKV